MANTNIAFSLLKGNLGFFGSPLDTEVEEYLTQLLEGAETELTSICGLSLDVNDIWDADLVAMYAAWLYRKRDSGEGKPPMLLSAIRNRQVRGTNRPQTGGDS